MWTFERYQTWLAKRTQWHIPDQAEEPPDDEPVEAAGASALPPLPVQRTKAGDTAAGAPIPSTSVGAKPAGAIEIEPVEGGLDELIKKLS
jgi:hypothetical protein